MNEHQASRTLVKSPPELWAECSDASSLTKHLDQFGEIKITKLDPETAVAWEGDRVSGTVRLEPSGWGTRVTLTAALDEDPAPEGEDEPNPAPTVVQTPPEAVASVPPPSFPPPEFSAPPQSSAPPESAAPPESSAPPESDPPPSVALTGPPTRGRGLFARLLSFLGPRREPPPGPPAPSLSGPEPVDEPPAPPEPELEAPGPELDTPPELHAPEPAETEGRSIFLLPERVDLEQSHPEPVADASEPAVDEPEPSRPESPVVAALNDAEAALVAALDSLGQAHHRPFSRA
jgi:hypothetical protein